MNFGVIAGALTGGAQQVISNADEQIKHDNTLDLAKQQQQLDIEKEGAVARLRTQSAIDLRMAETDTSPGGLATRTADAAVQSARALNPVEAERARAIADAQAASTLQAEENYGGNLRARAGVQAKARDQHITSPSEQATAYDLQQRKAIDHLRAGQAAAKGQGTEEGDKAAGIIGSQIATLTGAGSSPQDLQAAASNFEKLAAQERAKLNPTTNGGTVYSKEEAAAITATADRYARSAAQLTEGFAANRGMAKGAPDAPDDPKKNWPKVGTVVNGKTYKGGDPYQPVSWSSEKAAAAAATDPTAPAGRRDGRGPDAIQEVPAHRGQATPTFTWNGKVFSSKEEAQKARGY
jgi:hypothetical protein